MPGGAMLTLGPHHARRDGRIRPISPAIETNPKLSAIKPTIANNHQSLVCNFQLFVA
jgi:hypothetical protein